MKVKAGNRINPVRLALARTSAGLTQKDLVTKIAEVMEDTQSLNAQVVSSWERGNRPVPTKYETTLSMILGQSVEWFKRADERKENVKNTDAIEIMAADLVKYDGCPIWVEFHRHESPDGWALFSMRHKRLVFSEYFIPVNKYPEMHYYLSKPNANDIRFQMKHISLAFKDLIKEERVFVVMNTADKVVTALYNGWYHHNENKTALINDRGLILPYDGLHLSYNAYTYAHENE